MFAASGGVPRRINAICNRLLLAGFLSGQHRFSGSEVAAVAAEITGEIGPQAVVTPLREFAPLFSGGAGAGGGASGHPDLVGNVRRLLSMADRVDALERNVNELLTLVRALVEPERALPEDEPPRQEPPRRRRKTSSNA